MFDRSTAADAGSEFVYGRVPLAETPPDAVLVIENPCPHGLPDEWCEELCFDWSPEWVPPDGPEQDVNPCVPGLPGSRQALACEVAATAPDLLSRSALLDVCEAAERQIRWAQAVRIRMLAEFNARHPAGTSAAPPGADPSSALPVQRWVPDEVGLALDISRHEAAGQLATAERFVDLLPDTLTLLEAGRICWRRADSLAQATRILPDDKAREVEAMVLPKAPDSTPRQLRDRIRRAIAKVDPDGEYRRHKEADKERRVAPRALEDGMASLWCYGSAQEIEAAWNMIDRLARSLGPNDPRNLQQRRFDLAMQLMQGKLTITDPAEVDESVVALLAATWTAMTQNADPQHAEPETSDPETSAGSTGSTAGHRELDLDTGAPTDAADRHRGTAGDTRSTTSAGAGDDEAAADVPTDGPHDGPAADPDDQPPDGPPAANQHDPATPRARAAPQVPREVLTDAIAHVLTRRPDLHATVRKPLVQVVVGLDTLLGSQRPAELLGHGPIDADTARALAADAVIQRLITDPVTGTILEHGRTTYAPPAALADHVRSRDQICRGPRCTRRVRDLDHHIPFGGGHGGQTDDANLNGYCLHCHLLKDVPGWNVLPEPEGIVWISPCGRRTVSDPFDYRDFTDDLPAWDGHPPTTVDNGPTTQDPERTDSDPHDDPPPF